VHAADLLTTEQFAEKARYRPSLLDEHHALVRGELDARRGREVKTIGDGFLARFDSPASAIRAGRAIRDGVKRLHLEVRGGVHTGECEVQGTDLAGIAVHVAARILALAGPSEILCPRRCATLPPVLGSISRHAGSRNS
jgi:class 3 adenylate cyclase